MCQAYEGERAYMVSSEKAELRRKWEDHESGKRPLTKDEIQDLAVRLYMLNEQ